MAREDEVVGQWEGHVMMYMTVDGEVALGVEEVA